MHATLPGRLISIARTLATGAAALHLGLMAMPAHAKTKIVNEFTVAGWNAGQLRDETSNAFDSCFASGEYKSGILLAIFVTREYNWHIALINSKWTLPTREADVQYRYNGGAWLKTNGELDGDVIRMYMPSERTSAELFQASSLLEVRVEGQKYGFDLGGTRRMFSALLDCVETQLAAEGKPPATQSADTTAPAPPAATDNTPAEQRRSSSGTGFFVSPSVVLTNQHVIDGCTRIQVMRSGETARPVSLLRIDKTNDLALLKTEAPAAVKPAQLRPSGVRVGDQVAVFGYPLAGTLSTSGNLTSGNISSLAGISDDVRHFQISAPIQPGNSGGPLFDMAGNVIGITNMKLNELTTAEEIGTLPQNVNFAIKANVAINFLDAHSIAYETATGSTPLPLPDVVDKAKEFTVQVSCE